MHRATIFDGFFRKTLLTSLLLTATVGTLSAQKSFEISKQWDILHTLYRELDQYYVDSVAPEKVLSNAISGLMGSFDPYTNYIPESQTSELKFLTTGEYGGVGAMIGPRKSHIVVKEPYENMPAHKAGLKAGDVILEINDIKIAADSNLQASELLKGEPGTEVTLLIEREGVAKPFKRKIMRELITINQVTYFGLVAPGIGYINLYSFTDKSSQAVQRALTSLKSMGAQKVILDLRGNGGGLLNEAVSICNLFIPKGQEIVSTRGKMRQWDQTYKTTREPIDTLMPLVVMVNSGSASSSEIVCGALQDLDRAVLLGTRTFGKGLVQTTRSIPYNGMLKLTTAKYYIPSGRCIQAIDYSSRNKDGSVGRVPDSLMHVMYTKAGRLVRDGGGVQPDVVCEDQMGSNLSYALMDEFCFFDYANQYARTHETIPTVEAFTLSNQDFDDFLQFVKQRGFTYKRASQKQLAALKTQLEDELLTDRVKEELNALEAKLITTDLDTDFATYRTEIEMLLSGEIVSRYHFQSGELQQSLKFDPCLKEAIRVLNDENGYKKILNIK